MINVMSEHFLVRREGGVVIATFNRPEVYNAMTFDMYQRLADLCREVNNDHTVRAMVFTGAGKAFVAGTDISQFRTFESEADAVGYEARMDDVLGALEAVHVPTIAAINGPCVGGGAGIAATCDLRIGTPFAKFGFPIARTLGNCLSMQNYARLVALVGIPRVKDMIMTARLISPEEAVHAGLYKEVVEPDALMPRVLELAQQMTTYAPLTLRATKEALRRIKNKLVPEQNDHDLLLMCYLSNDFKAGVKAFLAKEPAQWNGD